MWPYMYHISCNLLSGGCFQLHHCGFRVLPSWWRLRQSMPSILLYWVYKLKAWQSTYIIYYYSSSEYLSFCDNLNHFLVGAHRTTVLQSMKLGIDVNRHKEVIVKAIGALLLLLLKHFKLNHIYQVSLMQILHLDHFESGVELSLSHTHIYIYIEMAL